MGLSPLARPRRRCQPVRFFVFVLPASQKALPGAHIKEMSLWPWSAPHEGPFLDSTQILKHSTQPEMRPASFGSCLCFGFGASMTCRSCQGSRMLLHFQDRRTQGDLGDAGPLGRRGFLTSQSQKLSTT